MRPDPPDGPVPALAPDADLATVLAAARACRLCAGALPHAPRPVLRARATARLLIIGQAPGRRVHDSGIPWNDPSGDRLRDWLALDRDRFYDDATVAIMPMGFCYPGTVNGADLPPRPECAPAWHDAVRARLPDIRLTLLVGGHAHRHYLGKAAGSVQQVVAAWRTAPAGVIPTPHPSWRTRSWQTRNPWFEAELLPVLRDRVAALLSG